MNSYNISGISVLSVDGNDFLRDILRQLLRAFGIRSFLEAKNGEDAFRQLKFTQPDIVFCDWEMDAINGHGFVRKVRTATDSPCPYIPIVVLTGHTEVQHIVAARDAGANGYLAKPVTPLLLYDRICRLIESDCRFVQCDAYSGPDRRKSSSREYPGVDRRIIDRSELNLGWDGIRGMNDEENRVIEQNSAPYRC